ncbi:cytochrome b5 reductase 4 isoform X2 [Denticeps clupeoides]|uniref:cytochrome b5 reductase 4 isoform X2 n=1 Tax=Denticeps clupeoides TaxID=299321 RepID=UPI0010A3ED07|nr:cytochrome b5 reductase 4 isoform X2 [Denticeps clupeoides]
MFRQRTEEPDIDEEYDDDIERGRTCFYILSIISDFMTGFLRSSLCFRGVGMLNVPAQSFPTMGSQQRVAPPGQAGRNKVALKPGHSLMDWIRLTKSGRDFTGLKGRIIEVTEEELMKHNTKDDCWTCIRGMVYNVSAYMDFHPGGEEELMRAAGVDGTDLFDQVHRWVNYESMLKECLIGRMAVKASTIIKGVTSLSPSPVPLEQPAAAAPPKDTRPRYDWFQTDTTVNVVVYTKRKNTGSGCVITDIVDGTLRLEIVLGKMSYLLHWQLSHEVEERIGIQTTSSVGKIQVLLWKKEKLNWSKVGKQLDSHHSFLRQKDRGFHYRRCVLLSKAEVTHDTKLFCLQLPAGSHMHVPVGKHVYLKALVQGSDVVKPYTPVESTLMPCMQSTEKEDNSSRLFLMIKIYPEGVLTPHLNCLQIGDPVFISNPDGLFSLRQLYDVTHLFLLAAGTGFTPMARLIRLALKELKMLRREVDVLWRSELDQLFAEEERFEMENVLSEPSDLWSGRRGHIEESMLLNFLEQPEGSKCLVCVCGPVAFTELAVRLVKNQGFSNDQIHAFQG